MRRRSHDRDLSRVLRGLPVPDHADDFFDRLRAELIADSVSDSAPDAEPSAVIDLSVRRSAAETKRRRFDRALRRATAPAAAVACFVLIVGGASLVQRSSDGNDPDKPEPNIPATAADFAKPKVQRLVVPQPAPAPKSALYVKFTKTDKNGSKSYDAVISPNGDYRMAKNYPEQLEITYDAATNMRREYRGDGSGSATQNNVPLGVPDGAPDGPTGNVNPVDSLSRDLGAAVIAIAAESPKDVTKTTLLGRLAIAYEGAAGCGDFCDTQKLTVDLASGFPLYIDQRLAGASVRTMTVTSLEEKQLADGDLAARLGPTVSTQDRSLGFRVRPGVPEAAADLPYQPLVPFWAPKSFELATVTFASRVPPPPKIKRPTYTDVVSLVYRNGLKSYTVSTRRVAAADAAGPIGNPLVAGTGLQDLSRLHRVDKGALAGIDLNVGIYPVVWPHVWARSGDLIVTVAGDLTREELLQVTGSLQRYVPKAP